MRNWLMSLLLFRSLRCRPRMRKATTRSRSTVPTPSHQRAPWSSSTPTSPRWPEADTSMACIPPTTSCTKRSRSRKASTTGPKSASMSSPVSRTATVCSGSATISGPACAFPIPGTGPSALAYPPRSAISAPCIRPTPGPGRSAPSSTRPWADGTAHSTPPSSAPGTAPT